MPKCFVTGELLLSLGNLFYKILELELIIKEYFVQGALVNTLYLTLTIRHYDTNLPDETHETKVFAQSNTTGELEGLGLQPR